MAIMSKRIDNPFVVASEKTDDFFRTMRKPKGERGSDLLLARAKKHENAMKSMQVGIIVHEK